MVARNSLELRAYFRQGRGRIFEDNAGDSLMNRMLDDQIDDFVRRLMAKSRQLEGAAWELSREEDGFKQDRWLRKIRETAADLEGTLRVWSDMLRPQHRAKGIEAPASTASREELLAQLGLYQQQIRQFLFPAEVAVSVSELRAEGFHGSLKRIQRLARALEEGRQLR